MRTRHLQPVMFLLALVCCGDVGAKDVSFNRDVRPILSDKCFACHGPDANTREAGLRLDLREEALDALSPDAPGESEVLRRIRETDPDVRMPPPSTHKRVTKEEAALLEEWIAEGAEYEPHWSLIPVVDSEVPQAGEGWGTNEIDAFVAARLGPRQPAPLADRRTLIRRVTLTLTGLPPAPDEVEAFVQDPAELDIAYERVVDRLLASPALGEHLAWHWLDAARYGDSDGYESDPMRNMWPWRDWVVESFNRNVPYDQFIVEQLAGDLLPDPSLRQMLATGFNRNHRLNNEGGILPEEWLVEYVADRAETTATVFMGLTWGCARCHDHKFDPITQRDYFRLFAYFHNVPEIGNGRGDSTARPMMTVSALDRLDEFADVSAEWEPLREAYDRVVGSKELKSRYAKWLDSLDEKSIAELPESVRDVPREKWDKKQQEAVRTHYIRAIDDEGRAAWKSLAPVQKRYDALARTGAKVMVMGEMERPRETFILNRGAYDQPGDPVTMGTPDWLPPMPEDFPKNRLGLAQWLVSPEHPLTSRVAVNRFWQLVFGRGLVETPEDFGMQGKPPTHPELLDWLASRFVQSGWDVRALLKMMVMSSTFRQQSSVSAELLQEDPENALLARGPRYRLPPAVIRDQALAASGLLVNKAGGPPVKPYQPDGLWQEIIKGRPVYRRDKGANLYRRSLYTLWRRAVKPPQMVLLDANDRDVCQVSQKRTNTPLQALLLLNDVTFVEAARGLATRTLAGGGETDARRVAFAFTVVLARPPRPQELTILEEELKAARARFRDDPASAQALVALGESPVDASLDPVELAAHTVIARILLNLDETIMLQ